MGGVMSPVLRRLLLNPDSGEYGPFRNIVPLTLANPITDLTRAAGLQGDGLPLGSGMGIWAAATNLCTNGGFETNTTGWTAGGTNTLAASAAQAKFGTKSGLATYADNATLADYAATITNAAHTASVWVYIPANYDGGGIELRQLNYTVAASATAANMALTDQWQRLTLTFTPGADVIGNLQVNNTGAAPTATRFVYIDGVQIETGSVAMPYIETDGGTAARSAARVQCPVSGLFTASQGGVFTRWRMGWSSASLPSADTRWWWWGVNDARICMSPTATAAQLISDTGPNVTVDQAGTWARDELIGIFGKWSNSSVDITKNVAAFTSAARAAVPTISQTKCDVGYRSDTNAGEVSSTAVWQAYFSLPPSNADSAALHSMGNAPNYHCLSRIANCTGVIDFREAIPVLRKRVGV